MNSSIIWQQTDGTLAYTFMGDNSDPLEHAKLLQTRGDLPADWTILAINTPFELNEGWRHEAYTWDAENKKPIVRLPEAIK